MFTELVLAYSNYIKWKITIKDRGMSFLSDSTRSGKHLTESFCMTPNTLPASIFVCASPSPPFGLVTEPSYCNTRAVMADEDNEFVRPRKIPKTLKEKDSGKRLIVILEKASLETVKVRIEHQIYQLEQSKVMFI